jgi:hypothetical protein
MKKSRSPLAGLLILAMALVAGGFLLAALRGPDVGKSRQRVDSDGQPRRPSPETVSRWLRASNDKLAARAADYEIDGPRRRNELGQALPFREASWGAGQVRAIQNAAKGEQVLLEFFPDVAYAGMVTGRWEDADGLRVAVSLQGRDARDRFFLSSSAAGVRGLAELPSINRAYEVIGSSRGGFVVLEWLYTDVVCATPTRDKGADAGVPKPALDAGQPSERIAPGEVPLLESRPGAPGVIYLDFDGEVVSGTAWASGATINAVPARMSAAEITETWERVSRHFEPFNVNVTTVRPVYEAAAPNRRTHCVVTQTDTAAPGAGGVAYLDSFTNADPSYKVCWSFIDDNAPNCALVISHEVGHTLDLSHDGKTGAPPPQNVYYYGHGSGVTGWGPFMGAPYGKNLLQWSKGEYDGANNTEDDLAIITASARIPYINDDHGSTDASATALVSGVATNGLVDRNTDADFFRVLIGSGPQPVTVSVPVGTMLDVVLNIFGEDGTLLETVNPADDLVASTTLNFPTARNVFLGIAGTGKPEVLGTGYSAYSSLGSYTLLAGTPLPQQVTGLTAAPVSDSAVDLFWSASPAAASYIVRRDGADITNTALTHLRNTGLSESTSYTYEVVATNGTGAAPASDAVSVATLSWVQANPYGFRVTNPSSLVSTSTSSFTFSGQMGAMLAEGVVQWTNSGRGVSGVVSPASTNWSQQIPVFSGTNRIVFVSSYPKVIGTNTAAYDGAGDRAYQSEGWVTGANGGYGFGAWSNTVTSANASLTVIDGFAATNMHVGTFNGFALRASGGSLAVARRPFLKPLGVGESFTINFDSNQLDAGRTVGFALADANQVARFTFSARGGTPNLYLIRDGAGTNTSTGMSYTTNGLLPVTFTLVTSNSYRLVAGTNAPITNNLLAGGAISRMVASNSSAGAGLNNAFFLGDMSIQSLTTSNVPVRVAAPFIVLPAGAPSTDGLPDSWWTQFFGTTSGVSASADPDGDGWSNAQEFALGTDPADGASGLVVTSLTPSSGTLSIAWSAIPGRSYLVESNGSLSDSNGWLSVGAPISAMSGETTLSTNMPVSGDKVFFRVRLLNSQ